MSCREHEDTILDLGRGVAGEREATSLLRHAEECPGCTLSLRRERELTAGLRALDAATPGEEPSPGVEAALLAAFAARQVSVVSPAEPGGDRHWQAWMAAAAALVLIVSGSLIWRESQTPRPGVPERLDARPVLGLRALDALPAAVPGQQAAFGTLRATVVSARSAPGSDASADEPGAFVPWPGAAALPAFENGELVRTEVPASVLPLLGIAGANQAAQATVMVDVVVGQDGYARAVRLAR
jgi:hypothetical protein